ncbi:MAG: CPBP family intramembrane metalloprotease [Anaerolineae bacterium]|nr:CPBP family intramembrane metalloprotease [Anaerolineae bacterium]
MEDKVGNKMFNAQESVTQKQGQTLLVCIIVAATVLPTLFFIVIDHWKLDGLLVYFLQLSLYLTLYLLASVGLKSDKVSLPINTRLIWQAVRWTLAGWLFYALAIHLLGLVKWPDGFQTLRTVPAWKVWAEILSNWFFVGLGEEILFRGYFLASFQQYLTKGPSRRRTIQASVLVSIFFSLWHLPV